MVDVVDRVLRFGEGKIVRKLESITRTVNAISDDFESMSDEELAGMTSELRGRYADGASLDELLPEAFATVRETSHRVLGKRHYDVQIMGGAALHLGNIAEMRTGEGKTLVATLPAYLNALTGKGVHVVTVNDYLATFQAEQMGRIYRFLGLSTSVVTNGLTPEERKKAYAADITYVTNNELGFDYLKDNMADTLTDQVQRGHHYAIVDEVDSILIDEARTPLIISGPTPDNVRWHRQFARIVRDMTRDIHYEVDESKRTVAILDAGIEMVEETLDLDNLYDPKNTPLISFMNNAVKARELFRRDKEYVVTDGNVYIVDEHTGRVLGSRRYSDGLHQAIEAKENVSVKEEYQTLASITLQNFFRMYEKLSGMTGTGKTEENEFAKIYGLGVIPIPTHKPVIRIDQPDLIFQTEKAKIAAIVDDIVMRHEVGQPVLIGTNSVKKSEELSQILTDRNVTHTVLNAKQHEREAEAVALAGHRRAVTVATNMAGRGTDIMLGGSVDFLVDKKLREEGLTPEDNPDEYQEQWDTWLPEIERQVHDEHDDVKALGGLYVIGTEKHESRRIDNQLRGRSGRQGDPGESRFYLALDDELLQLFKSDWATRVLKALNIPEDVPIETRRVGKVIESAQTQMESQNFESRKNVLKYDDVLNRQRHVVYTERQLVLDGVDVHDQVLHMIYDVVGLYVEGLTEGFSEEWDLESLSEEISRLTDDRTHLSLGDEDRVDEVREKTMEAVLTAYRQTYEQFDDDWVKDQERAVLLSVIDEKWRDHLYEMDYLREGIGMRTYAQKDPLVEYKREGYDMFNVMMGNIKENVVMSLFRMSSPPENETDETAPEPGAVSSSVIVEPKPKTRTLLG